MARIVLWEEAPLRVSALGQWLHGSTALHPRVQRLFAQNIAADDDGRWQVVLGHDRQPLWVDDTPLHVLSAHVHGGDGAVSDVQLHLSDGSQEGLLPQRLGLSDEHVLYTWVMRQKTSVPCRFLPQAMYALLLPLVSAHADDCIQWRGKSHRIGRWPDVLRQAKR